MSETAAKRKIQHMQRAIVDGLEDVKARDIQVFNTEHLSPLFERVIVASGSSGRQTRALAASVVDKLREAGFAKPRLEGEDNGEWIIVDCGPAVVHVMQPTIRQYYRLEEIWGDKPVRLRLAGPAGEGQKTTPAKTAAKKSAAPKAQTPVEEGAPARAPAVKKVAAKKTVAKKIATKTAPAKKAVTQKTAAKPSAKKPVKTPARQA